MLSARLHINRVGVFAVVATLAVVVVVVAVLAAVGGRSAGGGTANASAAGSLLDRVENVEVQVLQKVGDGTLPNTFYALQNSAPLTADGKPQLLYVGADYCPFCAAQRWSLVVALSRFGSFDDLRLTTSSSSDSFPDTATFSFLGTHYTSRYLDFVGVETADRNGTAQQTLSEAQKALLRSYDVPPYVPANAAGGIPWIDVGGRYAMISSGYNPGILAGLDWNAIAARLVDPNDIVAKGVLGNANHITAAICKVTDMQPADVCTTAPVSALLPTLP
jgi:type II secretory pathway pseudopilin PulG